MEKKIPTVLLLEDDLAEYNNWKKWINITQVKCQLLYVSDVESAIEEIKKNNIDIYIIDLHLTEGNALAFLNLIKNKKGLKFALTNSIDQIEYLEKLYELGAMPIAKTESLHEPMRIAELVFSLYDLGLDTEESSELSNSLKNEIITGVSTQLDLAISQVTMLKLDFESLVKEVATMKIYLLGDYQTVGLKAKVEMIEDDLSQLKDTRLSIVEEVFKGINHSPIYIKFMILILLGLCLVTLPLILIHKITGS